VGLADRIVRIWNFMVVVKIMSRFSGWCTSRCTSIPGHYRRTRTYAGHRQIGQYTDKG